MILLHVNINSPMTCDEVEACDRENRGLNGSWSGRKVSVQIVSELPPADVQRPLCSPSPPSAWRVGILRGEVREVGARSCKAS